MINVTLYFHRTTKRSIKFMCIQICWMESSCMIPIFVLLGKHYSSSCKITIIPLKELFNTSCKYISIYIDPSAIPLLNKSWKLLERWMITASFENGIWFIDTLVTSMTYLSVRINRTRLHQVLFKRIPKNVTSFESIC